MSEILSAMEQAVRDAFGNQIVGGGLVLMLAGSALALCRSVPARLWSLLQRRCIVTVDVLSDDPLFDWLRVWLDAQPYSKRARLLTASARGVSGGYGGAPMPVGPGGKTEPPPILFTPAPGNHVFWHEGRPLWFSRERRETPSGEAGRTIRQETITIRMIGRDAGPARGILEAARRLATQDERRVGVYVARYGDWRRIHEAKPRPLASVILPDGEMDALLADAETFLASGEWYAERGIPWRRGYLLEGVPGGGKTSAISALAGHLGLDLYLCNVAEFGMSDAELTSSLLQVPERAVVLLEDVDGVVQGREMAEKGGVTFSGLLNALDGVASRPGVLTFLTTNHAERLDPALLRRGRVDYRLHFGAATAEQGERFFRHFYRGNDRAPALAPRFGLLAKGQPMAELQHILVAHRDDPEGAIASLRPHAEIAA